jgi:hypothetical protein
MVTTRIPNSRKRGSDCRNLAQVAPLQPRPNRLHRRRQNRHLRNLPTTGLRGKQVPPGARKSRGTACRTRPAETRGACARLAGARARKPASGRRNPGRAESGKIGRRACDGTGHDSRRRQPARQVDDARRRASLARPDGLGSRYGWRLGASSAHMIQAFRN